MQIIIDGKKAALKQGTSFEFVSENRAFTSSDGYSLSITFPLRGCAENLAIFGHLNRTDVDNPTSTLDCEIHDGAFSKFGAIAVVELNEAEVKTQFLEGRSAQNYDVTFDDVYINELDLGEPHYLSPPPDPSDTWKGLSYGQDYVALPWVNNNADSGNIQNDVVYSDDAGYQWAESVEGLSFFPYLIVIAKRICEAVGYEYDFTEWESNEEKKYLLICNALPWAWNMPQFARALPHWSVTEFFEKLELFLSGEFDFDHKAKRVTFAFSRSILASKTAIRIDNVLDSFSSELTREDESEYMGSATLKYKECGHSMQKFYSCRWFLEEQKGNVYKYDTLSDLIEENMSQYRELNIISNKTRLNHILYAKDVDMYFIIRVWWQEPAFDTINTPYHTYSILQPINVFGEDVIVDDTENEIEIEFVPACIQETEPGKGHCLYLDLPSYDDYYEAEEPEGDYYKEGFQTLTALGLSAGQQEKTSEYFDVIYVGFWDGSHVQKGFLPYPVLDWITIFEGWREINTHFSMRLGNLRAPVPRIDGRQKFQFSFLWDGIPDVRAVFLIGGKKYLCEKITATFTENGMSQLKKGVFYRIVDE